MDRQTFALFQEFMDFQEFKKFRAWERAMRKSGAGSSHSTNPTLHPPIQAVAETVNTVHETGNAPAPAAAVEAVDAVHETENTPATAAAAAVDTTTTKKIEVNPRWMLNSMMGVNPTDRTAVQARRAEVRKECDRNDRPLNKAFSKWDRKEWRELVKTIHPVFEKKYGWDLDVLEAVMKSLCSDTSRNLRTKEKRARTDSAGPTVSEPSNATDITRAPKKVKEDDTQFTFLRRPVVKASVPPITITEEQNSVSGVGTAANPPAQTSIESPKPEITTPDLSIEVHWTSIIPQVSY
jgi:hypothetical protein